MKLNYAKTTRKLLADSKSDYAAKVYIAYNLGLGILPKTEQEPLTDELFNGVCEAIYQEYASTPNANIEEMVHLVLYFLTDYDGTGSLSYRANRMINGEIIISKISKGIY